MTYDYVIRYGTPIHCLIIMILFYFISLTLLNIINHKPIRLELIRFTGSLPQFNIISFIIVIL